MPDLVQSSKGSDFSIYLIPIPLDGGMVSKFSLHGKKMAPAVPAEWAQEPGLGSRVGSGTRPKDADKVLSST